MFYLVLNGLALLVRDPLGDHLAVNFLNVLASGDRLLSGSLLGGVGADLLGHFAAVRLDSHLAGGLGNSLNLDCWSSMNCSTIAAVDSSAIGNSSTISTVSTITMASLSLPLVDAIAQFP